MPLGMRVLPAPGSTRITRTVWVPLALTMPSSLRMTSTPPGRVLVLVAKRSVKSTTASSSRCVLRRSTRRGSDSPGNVRVIWERTFAMRAVPSASTPRIGFTHWNATSSSRLETAIERGAA